MIGCHQELHPSGKERYYRVFVDSLQTVSHARIKHLTFVKPRLQLLYSSMVNSEFTLMYYLISDDLSRFDAVIVGYTLHRCQCGYSFQRAPSYNTQFDIILLNRWIPSVEYCTLYPFVMIILWFWMYGSCGHTLWLFSAICGSIRGPIHSRNEVDFALKPEEIADSMGRLDETARHDTLGS